MVRAGLVLNNVTPGKRVWSSRSGNYIPVVTGDRKTREAFPGESQGGAGGCWRGPLQNPLDERCDNPQASSTWKVRLKRTT